MGSYGGGNMRCVVLMNCATNVTIAEGIYAKFNSSCMHFFITSCNAPPHCVLNVEGDANARLPRVYTQARAVKASEIVEPQNQD